ncbi:MAG: inorganic phosphate transporter [Deltaproteobacteria bacterium]|nr:inorganic phosphate transporter [Deltaproteobacteria bacterium]
MSTVVITGILLALLFDFLNGMNDAANSIATVVSTRVLSPKLAVAWAAFFNFIAAFLFELKVAGTIGKGVVDPSVVTPELVISALVGAVLWTHACTHLGLPISVSHSLIGGLAGAALLAGGPSALVGSGIATVAIFIALSPIIGMLLAAGLMIITYWVVSRWQRSRVEKASRKLQLFSAAAYSLGHGLNDAQKTMGIIVMLLVASHAAGDHLPAWVFDGDRGFYVPVWVLIACNTAIGLGTLAGGWKVIRTMGMKLTRLRPLNAFCAETGGAMSILLSSFLGIPVSTTHTITGAIAGVGTVMNVRAVRWGIASHILWAWFLTIPVSGLVGAGSFWLYRLIFVS